ncbi:oxidoreductase, partial [Escherichia coli]|nr:oxidoreductase [Escherichia coli]
MSKIIKLQNGAPQIVADEWTVLRTPEGGELTQADVDA